MEAAKKKIVELEVHLGEKDAATAKIAELEGHLGEKDAQLDSAKTETARLSKVEIELQARVQQLTRDLAARDATHAADLHRLLEARDEVEGQLMKERDLAVKRLEDESAQHQGQIRAARAKYNLSLASLHRADIALAGMSCFLAPYYSELTLSLFRSHSSFWLILLDAWPNSTPAAEEAVAAARLVRGETVAPDAGWNVKDFAVALDARIPQVKGALCTYKAGVQKLNDMLFRSRTRPIVLQTNEDVARNLKAAPRQLAIMLDSAFRCGVQASLAIVKSWYPTVNLNLLRVMRDHSDAAVGAVWTEICQVAAELVNAVNLLEYTPYLDDEGRPISPVELSDLQYTSSEDTEA